MVEREDYVRAVINRVLELLHPAPPGFWQNDAAWLRIVAATEEMRTNEATEDFLAGRTGKAEFDGAMRDWLEMWRKEYRDHEQRAAPP